MSHIFTHIKSNLDLIPSIEGIVKNKFDNIIEIDNNEKYYEKYYENLMKKMKELLNTDKIHINMSTDSTVSASTLSAINRYIDEKYINTTHTNNIKNIQDIINKSKNKLNISCIKGIE